jgi:hypothetical protein
MTVSSQQGRGSRRLDLSPEHPSFRNTAGGRWTWWTMVLLT